MTRAIEPADRDGAVIYGCHGQFAVVNDSLVTEAAGGLLSSGHSAGSKKGCPDEHPNALCLSPNAVCGLDTVCGEAE